MPRARSRLTIATAFVVIPAFVLTTCAESGRAGTGSKEQLRSADDGAVDLPGTPAFPPEFRSRTWAAYEAMGAEYVPRTEHVREDGRPIYVNRLILEDSPYLIQHAHNPVNWFPWGDEAFEKARREGKPIFLSIGYSTCHWCHVMERESFDDVGVATLLNEGFVAIKVDREQRPDVDEVYMTAVQLLTGSGGWPMSSLLTPDGKTFFGGTYMPRDTFVQLLQRSQQAWLNERPRIMRSADRIAQAVREYTASAASAGAVSDDLVATAARASLTRHDAEFGGFSTGAPKFPNEPELLFLLDRVWRTGDRAILAAVETTLQHMARGGIYDQIGGGFHRYSTDIRWLVPHFEKMLYNQAHLSRAYTEAFQLTGQSLYARVARQTLDYVLRDMTSADGGFFSATDADSEGEEGRFFLWTPDEIRAVLTPDDVELAIAVFGVTDAGVLDGRSILHLPQPLSDVAAARGERLDDLYVALDRLRDRLQAVRATRVHPLRDDKIVTAWNAMMITALSRAAVVFGEPAYAESAVRAAQFLWTHNRRADGGLWRAHLDGRSSVTATVNDYAYLVEALVELHDLTREARWLDRARDVADTMIDRFWDADEAGFFMSENDHNGRLPARPKSAVDGAIPSGNSVAVRALARLSARTGDDRHRRHATQGLAAFAGAIEQSPAAFSYLLLGASELSHGAAGPVEYGAKGALRATAAIRPNPDARQLIVELEIGEGWHVNAHRPLQDDLIPTTLDLADDMGVSALRDVRYPVSDTVTLGFQAEPLSVYQGRVVLSATVTSSTGATPLSIPVRLTTQACNDRLCLAPEVLALEVPWP